MKQKFLSLLLLTIALGSCGPDSNKKSPPPPQPTTGRQQQPLALPTTVILPTEVSAQGTAIGSIDNSSGATADGVATYRIPLWTPAGRAGIQPDLSLTYSSDEGNGLIGVGWRLSGTSRITRCGRTVVQDGEASPITFSTSDVFCLDGQRLVAVQGDYGASETEYRTELESFTKILSLGADEYGPERFEVYLKDGRVLSYGLENGSSLMGRRIQVRPGEDTNIETTLEPALNRYAWALAKISDRVGNFLSFHYTLTSPPGDHGYEHLLSRIEYTASSIAPTTPATRFVHVKYQPRPDTRSQYVAGLKLVSTQRIESMEMHGPKPFSAGLLRSYRFTYALSTLRGSSELRTLTECDGSQVCKRPLMFSYAPDQTVFSEINTGAADLTDLPNSDGNRDNWLLQTADMNGDGREDLIYRKSAGAQDPSNGYSLFKWVVRHALPQGVGVGPPVDTALPTTCASPRLGENGRWLDLNGDGLTDISLVQKFGCDPQSTRQFNNYLNSSTGLQLVDTGSARDMWFADLEGDGLMESLQVVPTPAGEQLSYRPNINGVLQPLLPISTSYLNDNVAFSLDLHATGRMGLLITDKDVPPGGGLGVMWQRYWAVEKSNGQFHKQATTLVRTEVNDKVYLFADINGDKLPDAIRSPTTGGTGLETLINTGNGFAEPVPHTLPANATLGPWSRDNGVRIVDFDRDGRDDLLLLGSHPQRPSPVVLLSRDNSFIVHPLAIPFGRTTLSGYVLSQTLDLDGDGRIDIAQVVDGTLRIYKQQNTLPGMLVQAENSLGSKVNFVYKPLTDSTVYQPGTNCGLPRPCVKRGKWVVAEHQTDAGEGHPTRATRYSYEDGRIDSAGRGWLGFAAVVTTNLQTGSILRTEYDNQTKVGTLYPYIMKPIRMRTQVVEGDLHTTIEQLMTYQNSVRVGADGVSRITTVSLAGGQDSEVTHSQSVPASSGFTRTTTTTLQHDPVYGNLLSKTQQTVGGDSSTVTVEYSNTASTWRIGLPTRVQESNTVGGLTTTRTKRMEYAPSTGLLEKEVTDPDSPSQKLIVHYSRDSDGLVSQIAREVAGLPSRTTTFTHDLVDRTYPASVTNAVGHTIQYAYHPGLGVLGVTVDENDVRTEWQYDGWGRVRRENGPTLADTTVNYTASSIAGQAFQVHTRQDGGKETWTGYDRLGRIVTERSLAFAAQTYTDLSREYDGLGRLVQVKSPNPRGGTNPVTTMFQYDKLGRTTKTLNPDGTSISTSFTAAPEGLWIRTVDEKGNVSRVLVDANSRTVRSEDEKAPSAILATTYEYGPFGVLRKARDSANNEVLFEYDSWGRRTRQVDPDSGEDLTTFNPFGDVVQTRDGNGTVTQFQHDAHGRVVRFDSTKDGRSTFEWDQGAHAKGRMTTSTRHGDLSTTLDDIVVGYAFDSQGRPETETWSIETRLYTLSRTYDAHGRPSQLTYPSVQGQALRVEHGYSSWNGQLTVVKEPGTSGTVHWRADAVTKLGQLSQETFGNGVVTRRLYDVLGRLKFIDSKLQPAGTPIQALAYDYESNGNLRTRHDRIAKTSESFAYDALDRITRWSVTQNCNTSILSYGYDDLGNLTSRTVAQGTGVGGTYTYGAGTAGPHAITGSAEGTYTYDSGGNQLEAPGRSAQFTGFRLPSSITDGVKTVSFRYDALQRRAVKQSTDGSVTSYVGGLYEERRTLDGTVVHAFLVQGAGRAVAQVVWKAVAGNPTLEKRWFYLHQDHLGSLESLTDASGAVVLRSKHEPFGQRRQPGNLTAPETTSPGDMRLGFTGHEHDDELRLINMRGRMYDPQTGRFLSPDPSVQAPLFGQSFNRYSYVLNNPLRFSDPSGFVTSERVTYYDSWYGGYVSRDFAAGTPASSFSPDLGWGTMEGFFAALHGRSLDPIIRTESSTEGSSSTSYTNRSHEGKSMLGTIVRELRYGPAPSASALSGYLLLVYYHWTQSYTGVLMGATYGAIPFSNLLPLPDGMSDDARFGFSLGLGAASAVEFLTGLASIARGVGESGTAMGSMLFTDVGILTAPLAIDGAAAIYTGRVLVLDSSLKASRALNILAGDIVAHMMSGSGGPGSGGGSGSSGMTIGGRPWRAHKVGDTACQSGCEDVATEIQRRMGGDIKVITQPHGHGYLGGMRDPGGIEFKNPAGHQPPWTFHVVVTKNGRVYDAFTGPAGEAFSAYKARWEFADVINFGF
ncbi:RHS repeat-associated core domain-containing protein [Myxococcus sp. CA039A]|uniref:RHS repeat-associated core domain-containing protein n=1 Tax=Myxococcus sp. CA039A TaxID=2741737 RepID=UPI00157B905F|nr:RHS repeat-associated core domain-containing protein [Myxococcus sp. CA039A]NTX51806.1 VCBS repeat-containing protein [Myxococcus sp. CA039A]